jgi:hypothetical protein
MKIKIIIGLFGLALIFGAVGVVNVQAAAPTIAELQAQIEALKQQLTTLQAKRALVRPKIVSIESPATLKVGEAGTWMLKANKLPAGVKANFQTGWGEQPEVSIMQVPTPANGRQFIHFRNTYTKPGVYTQTFFVSALGLMSDVATTTVTVTVTR